MYMFAQEIICMNIWFFRGVLNIFGYPVLV
ncbi:hypothetical protein SAMN05444285_11953 [Draconibacterium orientale]|uniref:Uncharacterized protein n=1 Tax=Draconibacterium orientale TaxID=1168034 RepID=A0A1I0G8F3_9BACT|nr:hypothetical protein SAMN05444285_11953 [Draconibacterium orientale]